MLDRSGIEDALARAAAAQGRAERDGRFAGLLDDGSPALRLTRVVAHAHVWGGDDISSFALVLALRHAWAAYDDRRDPASVSDRGVADAVEAAASETLHLDDRADAPLLAVALIGDALGAYHGAIELGIPGQAREVVRSKVAIALAYAIGAVAPGAPSR